MGNNPVNDIVDHLEFELVAVADVSPEKLKMVYEKYGVQGYLDAYEMMDVVKPDLVVVASPTKFHAEHAAGAMERGIDVFLEKPMARNPDEARMISSVQEKTGRKLMVYQPHRIRPDTITVKKIIEKGVLGDIFMIKYAMSSFFIRSSWQAYKENGGGTLKNRGSHYIDLLLYLTGGRAEYVSCELQRVVTTGDADDCARVLIKTDNGILLDIDMILISAFDLAKWQIFGSCGTAIYTINNAGNGVIRARYYEAGVILEKQTYHKTGGLNDPAEYPWIVEDFEIKDEYGLNFYDKCYEYYALGKEPFVPMNETLAVMDVLRRCHDVTGRY